MRVLSTKREKYHESDDENFLSNNSKDNSLVWSSLEEKVLTELDAMIVLFSNGLESFYGLEKYSAPLIYHLEYADR